GVSFLQEIIGGQYEGSEIVLVERGNERLEGRAREPEGSLRPYRTLNLIIEHHLDRLGDPLPLDRRTDEHGWLAHAHVARITQEPASTRIRRARAITVGFASAGRETERSRCRWSAARTGARSPARRGARRS